VRVLCVNVSVFADFVCVFVYLCVLVCVCDVRFFECLCVCDCYVW